MWETIREIFISKDVWGAIANLLIGAMLGGFVGVKYTLRAQRPKLIIDGEGSGGSQQKQSWNITISNRPSFFGQFLDGDPARDIHAHLRLNEKRADSYFIYWGIDFDHRVTIEAGQSQSLTLFHWVEGSDGYFVIDNKSEPVARFQGRERKFLLTLHDRLDRKYEFPITVYYDDSHLKHSPRLRIVSPMSLRNRIARIKSGYREIISAFRSR